jgi:hypothetical protein
MLLEVHDDDVNSSIADVDNSEFKKHPSSRVNAKSINP